LSKGRLRVDQCDDVVRLHGDAAVVEKFSRPFESDMPPPEFDPSVMIVAV